MKRIILLLSVIYSVNSSICQQVDDWEIVFYGKNDSATFTPSQLKFIDSDNYGFVDGRRGFGGLTHSFYLSENEPKNINKILEFNNNDSIRIIIQDWIYLSNKTIFLLVDSSKFDHYDGINIYYNYKTFILKSINGGDNWETININSNWRSRPSSIIQMSNDSIGMIVQFPSIYEITETTDLIWVTNDGWKTFNKINSHPELVGTQNGLFNNKGRITLRTLANLFFISDDYGASWIKKDMPIELKLSKDFTNDVILYNDSTFFRIANVKVNDVSANRSVVGKTTNTGDNWDIIWDSTKLGDNILNLSIINSERYYAHGSKLRLTIDGGETWTEKPDFYLDGNKTPIFNLFEFPNGVKIAQAGYAILKNKGVTTLKSPEFISPDSVYNIPLTFELKWYDIIGADKYHLQIEIRDGAPIDSIRPQVKFDKELYVNDSNFVDNKFLINNAQPYKEYSCRIRALNSTQSSNWVLKSFTTTKITYVNSEIMNRDHIILISPNPASDYIEISVGNVILSEAKDPGIRIYDVMGFGHSTSPQPLSMLGEGKMRIDVSHLSPGVYFVRVGNVVRKFIKF